MLDAQLNQTRDSATISASGTVTARELEQLLFQLAELRSQMTPEVPHGISQAISEDAPIMEVDTPTSHFGVTGAGALRIALRHPGIGWLAFLLPRQDVEGLANLIGKKRADGGATQH